MTRAEAVAAFVHAATHDDGLGPPLDYSEAAAAFRALGVTDDEIDAAIGDDKYLQRWRRIGLRWPLMSS